MSPLVAQGLHRFYRRGDTEVAALLDVSVVCAAGETIAVTGASGSGKSTLLTLLAGLDDPDGGSVSVAGERLDHRSPRDGARLRARHVGVLTQSSGLLGHLSLLQNVQLAASLRRARKTEGRELLDQLELGPLVHAHPRTLSGGETVRAGLAIALAGAPVVLLADEPTAEVSRDEEATILDLLLRHRPPEAATVIVTHSDAVARYADRVVHLVDGRIT